MNLRSSLLKIEAIAGLATAGSEAAAHEDGSNRPSGGWQSVPAAAAAEVANSAGAKAASAEKPEAAEMVGTGEASSESGPGLRRSGRRRSSSGWAATATVGGAVLDADGSSFGHGPSPVKAGAQAAYRIKTRGAMATVMMISKINQVRGEGAATGLHVSRACVCLLLWEEDDARCAAPRHEPKHLPPTHRRRATAIQNIFHPLTTAAPLPPRITTDSGSLGYFAGAGGVGGTDFGVRSRGAVRALLPHEWRARAEFWVRGAAGAWRGGGDGRANPGHGQLAALRPRL